VLLERDLLLMLLYIAKLDLWLTFFDLSIVVGRARDAQTPKASAAIRSAVFVKEVGEDSKGYDKEEPGDSRETDSGARALDARLLF